MPKLRIEEAAARKQALIDKGEKVIVGVNKYRTDQESEIDILEIDNSEVLKNQLSRLENLKQARDNTAVDAALDAVYKAATSGEGNLLKLSINAVKARATLGEISSAIERAFGRFKAQSQTILGIYGGLYREDEGWQRITERVQKFEKENGRRPRMLVCKMGQDGHDRGAKVIATAFADAGFDIDLSPLFSVPSEVARQAVENDVHIIGVSSQAAGHKTMIPQLMEELKKAKAEDIIVIIGGVIPKHDYEFLKEAGVKGIFGPGTPIPSAAEEVLDIIQARSQV
jgi:methylmalonyl-CoA mutase